MIKFGRLVSGGIITNYDCSSKCRHCVYCSSPSWPKDYMTEDMAVEIFSFLKKSGCHSVHIGGGEPLLRPDRLFPVLKGAEKCGMGIEYIETNASWYMDPEKAEELLRRLKEHGIDTLLISIDPFHNEYIPFRKVKGLVNSCQRCGISVFPWLMEFWGDLEALGDDRPHRLEEYEKLFGAGYERELMKRYHLNLRGRALQTFRKYLKDMPLEEILERSGPCRELTGTYHFHVDLYGNYVPQSCAGLSISFRDLAKGADDEKYPIINELAATGIGGLLKLACNEYGYEPKDRYIGKCDLCYDIRRYLVIDKNVESPDLEPRGHYVYV